MALNDAKVKAAKPREKAYKLTDGGQLFLHVTPAGGKHWRMNYAFGGKQRTLTIGPYPIITLGEARDRRDAAKRQLLDGRDPAVEKRLAAGARADAYEATFEVVARRWFETNKARWSAHHAADVIRSLERDVFPSIGAIPIVDLQPPRILAVLRQIQDRGSIETAQRIQQRMSGVFGYGMAAGVATANPAAVVRDALKRVVLKRRQPAITTLDGVRRLLRDVEAADAQIVTKLAHRFLALTSVRPGEVRGAAWSELEDVDLTGVGYGPFRPLWRIPAERMKGDLKRKDELAGDHLVPLAPAAVDVLVQLRRFTGRGKLLFPNHWHVHKPMSENAIGFLLNRVGYQGRHVPHGWRAAFSTIMNARAERMKNYGDRAIIDLMLAHMPKGKVEGAYNRAAFMERRRELAQDWAALIMEGLPSAAALI